ncbi:hypothetical protein ERAQ111492_05465 [Erysipelothrix aquatica]|uniref:hypothetical protein n=2 Tax=Erysipelothrix aquatica TaxID=2683714 RepID=UPI001356D28E|nr:hypothetical protein [Erysipelothrix aquatica]
MEIMRLLYKDILKLKSLIFSFLIQLFISIFCLVLVSNQFYNGLSNIVVMNSVKNNNIIGIRTQEKTNIIDEEDGDVTKNGLAYVLGQHKSYSWYTNYENLITEIQFFGDYLGANNQVLNTDLLIFGENVSEETANKYLSKLKIPREAAINGSKFFDSRNGSVDLQNAIVIVNSDSESIKDLDHEQQQQLLHNLHLYDSSEEDVKSVISYLNSEKRVVYPKYINETNKFVQLFVNDIVLFSYFSVVFLFVLLNLYIIIYDIVRSNNREYAISKLYGATNFQIILRIEILVSCIYLIPSFILSRLFIGLIPNRLTLMYLYIALVIGQIAVTIPVIKKFTKKDVSCQLRSDY